MARAMPVAGLGVLLGLFMVWSLMQRNEQREKQLQQVMQVMQEADRPALQPARAVSTPPPAPPPPAPTPAPTNVGGILDYSKNGSKCDLQEALVTVSTTKAQKEKRLARCKIAGHAHPVLKSCKFVFRESITFKMAVYSDCDIVSCLVVNTCMWERVLTKSIFNALGGLSKRADKAVMLDIGGNVGWFSTFAAAAGHTVYTFEPMVANADLIQSTIAANPGFKDRLLLHRHGLTDGIAQDCGFVSSATNRGDGQILCGAHLKRTQQESKTVTRPFRLERLDEVMKDVPRVDVIKIDVEGHELQALKGGEKMLRKWRPKVIYTEYTFAAKNRDYWNFLTGLGYEAHAVHDLKTADDGWHGRKLKINPSIGPMVTASEIAFILKD